MILPSRRLSTVVELLVLYEWLARILDTIVRPNPRAAVESS